MSSTPRIGIVGGGIVGLATAHRISERFYPKEPMTTTIRLVDTFFPVARGGTGCIPGPFGAGKTVLLETNGSLAMAAVDPRVYRIVDRSAVPLTPEPAIEAGERFGDLVRLGDRILAVQERVPGLPDRRNPAPQGSVLRLQGWHAQPPEMFSEEYQVEFLRQTMAMLAGRPSLKRSSS